MIHNFCDSLLLILCCFYIEITFFSSKAFFYTEFKELIDILLSGLFNKVGGSWFIFALVVLKFLFYFSIFEGVSFSLPLLEKASFSYLPFEDDDGNVTVGFGFTWAYTFLTASLRGMNRNAGVVPYF